MKSLPEFKNKLYNDLSNAEKLAFVERVCMDNIEYLNSIDRQGKEARFINEWKDRILTLKFPSNSNYMDHYLYDENDGICVVSKDGFKSRLTYNVPEIIIFVFNAITVIPVKSNLIEKIKSGVSVKDLEDEGIEKTSILEPLQGLKKKEAHRPINPNSRRQRVLRGEISYYEAYQKTQSSDDDAL